MFIEQTLDLWAPKTALGRMVKSGSITTMDQIFAMGLTIKEPEIVSVLLPGLSHEIVSVDLVQNQTDTVRLTVGRKLESFQGLRS